MINDSDWGKYGGGDTRGDSYNGDECNGGNGDNVGDVDDGYDGLNGENDRSDVHS